MIRDFLVWLRTELGAAGGDTTQSWSEALLGSPNFRGLLEGVHLRSAHDLERIVR